MRKTGFALLVPGILLLVQALGCPKPLPNPEPPDAVVDGGEGGVAVDAAPWAPDASPELPATVDGATACPACKGACEALERLGCPEAHPDGGDGCYAVLSHAQASKKFDLRPYCLAAAKTREELARCGTVRCKAP